MTVGLGIPVTLHTSNTVSFSFTIMSSLDNSSMIVAGTVNKMEQIDSRYIMIITIANFEMTINFAASSVIQTLVYCDSLQRLKLEVCVCVCMACSDYVYNCLFLYSGGLL